MKKYKHRFTEKESDITIVSDSVIAIKKAIDTFYSERKLLEDYVAKHKNFLKSFKPVKIDTNFKIINLMERYSRLCEVGPMATVAGALADLMVKSMKDEEKLKENAAKVALVENGGEIFIDSEEELTIALYAGNNNLNLNLGFLIEKWNNPIGIATSSGTVGHAFSFGDADAVTIFAENATLADGAATKIANLVKGNDIEKSIKIGLDAAQDIAGVRGVFISRRNMVGHIGKIPKMIKIEGNKSKILIDKTEKVLPSEFKNFK
ncbi:MAG: UPF0280 family protein [Candidatus Lokiarchaeota archaeon]|nr:UPF0280 family protein [Candidatus Lokiarchaeota archaeon]